MEKERRHQRRQDCRADIEWSYFNRRERYGGAMLNYSEFGAYIESHRELKPGSTILLHTERVMIACETADNCVPPNATLLAEIKWRRTDAADDGAPRFGAGIRYHL